MYDRRSGGGGLRVQAEEEWRESIRRRAQSQGALFRSLASIAAPQQNMSAHTLEHDSTHGADTAMPAVIMNVETLAMARDHKPRRMDG